MDILITGCSRGIGLELVKLMSAQGHRVLAVSRNIQALENISSLVTPLSLDITQSNFSSALVQKMNAINMYPDCVINNAGNLVNKPFDQLSADDFDAMFHVNMKGPFLLLQALADRLRKGAHVVNIGSMGGYQGSAKFAGLSLYSASKAALAVFSECLAEEWKEKGVKVNCLALGAAQTEMLEAAFPGYNAPVSAAEMASFIADFSLNGHRFFNGKVLPVSVSTP
jgi:NAD(P)-dependent dehydrogenase (short-subunit alcohol dehydrogenase family)